MNISEMSCEQVNEAIAKLRLEWVDDSAETVRDGWRQINVPLRPFDYCRDWAACGPLLEEMYAANHGLLWVRTATMSTPLTEATARAWLQWKTEER